HLRVDLRVRNVPLPEGRPVVDDVEVDVDRPAVREGRPARMLREQARRLLFDEGRLLLVHGPRAAPPSALAEGPLAPPRLTPELDGGRRAGVVALGVARRGPEREEEEQGGSKAAPGRSCHG